MRPGGTLYSFGRGRASGLGATGAGIRLPGVEKWAQVVHMGSPPTSAFSLLHRSLGMHTTFRTRMRGLARISCAWLWASM